MFKSVNQYSVQVDGVVSIIDYHMMK